jgi:hypothetical protein
MNARFALRAFGVGAATGLRTMTGPAFAFSANSGNWNWLFRAAALGEYVADKLPNTVAIGGAMATAYLGVAYRKVCAERKLPPVAVALAEDAFAAALAWSVVPRKAG